MEFSVGGLHSVVSDEFNFGLYLSNITLILHEAQITHYQFSEQHLISCYVKYTCN